MQTWLQLFACLLIPFSVFSQISIEKDDLPQPGDSALLSSANVRGISVPTATGSMYTWDYSNLQAVSQQNQGYVSVFFTPFAYQFYFNSPILFPQYRATVAQAGASISGNFLGGILFSNVYNYYRLTNNIFAQVGFGADLNGIPTSERYIPIDTIFTLPLTYGNTGRYTSGYGVQIAGTGSYYHKQIRNYVVDGFGTLKLPMGDFEVIRVKTTYTNTDSIFMSSLGFGFNIPQPSQTEYKWLAKDESFPVLTITVRNGIVGNGTVNSVVYKDIPRFTALDEIGNNDFDFSVYPNPSNGSFTIQSYENQILNLVNPLGETVAILNCNYGSNNYNMEYLPSGYYLIVSEYNTTVKRPLIIRHN